MWEWKEEDSRKCSRGLSISLDNDMACATEEEKSKSVCLLATWRIKKQEKEKEILTEKIKWEQKIKKLSIRVVDFKITSQHLHQATLELHFC